MAAKPIALNRATLLPGLDGFGLLGGGAVVAHCVPPLVGACEVIDLIFERTPAVTFDFEGREIEGRWMPDFVTAFHAVDTDSSSPTKRLQDRALARVQAGDLAGACCMVGRDPAPCFLDTWRRAGLVSDEMLRAELLQVWQLVEFPCRALPRRTWLEWFRISGFLSDTGQPAPATAIEVWRSQVGRVLGLSWTRDPSKAAWFQKRNLQMFRHANAQILHGFAPPDAVLAMIESDDSRGEAEVVLDPIVMRKRGKVAIHGGE